METLVGTALGLAVFLIPPIIGIKIAIKYDKKDLIMPGFFIWSVLCAIVPVVILIIQGGCGNG